MKTSSLILLSGLSLTVLLSTRLINTFDNKTSLDKQDLQLKIDTPDQNRFVKVNLVQGQFTEPTEMAVLPNLDILVAQRRGELMLYKNQTKKLSQVAKLDVYAKTSLADVNAEEGLLGLTIDPKYASNQYVYLFYSPMGKSVNRLSRFKMVNDMLSMSSEKVILEFYSQREICCHTGGSLAFGPDGLLYISTGDNSTPFDVPKQQFVNKGYAPLDNRPGLQQYDSRRSAGNTNDLRGKILRIRVKEDGTYSIPEGNLFAEGESKARPEIFVMGNRNPYRISVDQKTGFLYWGEVGPDASNDDELRGPRGYDEINQAKKAGNFGWPYFIGNNYPYRAFDYTNGENGAPFDVAGAVNNSPNNTGLAKVPSAQPAFIWYPYNESKEFPQVGSGGRTAMAGPVLYNKPGASPYPAYYNGKLIIYEWVRGWVKAVSMAPNGDYSSMEPIMANLSFAAPIDMELGPDGKIYVLEYGKGWFSKNPDAGIARVDYLKGNRPPSITSLNIDKPSGLLPYKLIARVKATDADGGKLTYVWNIGNGIKKTTTTPELTYTFTKAGEYPISVQVLDADKASAKSAVIPVFAGNEHPKVNIVLGGNKSFYFPGKPVDYQVLVTDNAKVNKDQIYVSSSYTEGSDLAGAQLGHQQAAQSLVGKSLMMKSDCSTCHKVSAVSIGPAFTKVSSKYQENPNAIEYLASKVIKGSSGVWGEVPMPAHPAMKESEVKQIVEWVMSLSAKNAASASLPTTGKITPPESINKDKSVLTLKASYTDMGAKGLKSLTTTNTYNLKSSVINFADIKDFSGFSRGSNINEFGLIKDSGWLKLSLIDLTDVKEFKLTSFVRAAEVDYDLELRLDNLNGKIIGKSSLSKSVIPIEEVGDGKFHNVFILFKASKAVPNNKLTVKSITVMAK